MKKKSLLLTAVATLGLTAATMAQNVPSYVPTNGLVGWWPFNGNANDESGNGNHGIVNGAMLTSDRFGNNNKAYTLDGVNDFIEVPDNNSLDINGNISMSVWVNLESIGDYRIIDKVTVNFGGAYGIDFSGLTANVIDRLRYLNGSEQSLPFGLDTNENFHIVVTYDQINLKYYINGQLNNSIPKTGLANNNNNPLRFGANSLLNDNWFHGKLDDIGIWNRALTQQEITALYSAVNCANNTTITPPTNTLQTGNTASFTASTSDSNPSFAWQSNLGQGFQTLNTIENYSGTNTANLSIANIQLSNHNQPIRVITTSGNCIDTSTTAIISITDTCINSVTDTSLITVTDTLLINTSITGLNPPGNTNTIKIFTNPTNDHITVHYGNFPVMTGYQLRIENSLGQQVFQTNIFQQSDYLSLANWGGNGLYFVHIIDPLGNTIDIRKIVMQ